MAYINTATNQYPLFEQQIREALPRVSFTTPFAAPAPYVIVFPSPSPGYDSDDEYIEEGFPENIDGQFYQTWLVKSKWASQEEAAQAAAERLGVAKNAKNVEINEARLKANREWFVFNDSRIACDQLSREDIDGVNGEVLNTGALPANWPGGWKHMDNGYVAITDVDTWKLFYSAMVAQGIANFLKAQSLKQRVENATTVQEVNAIKWED